MYRISVMINRRGYGTTLVPPFYVNMGENGIVTENDAKRIALDIVDPTGTIQANGADEILITVS